MEMLRKSQMDFSFISSFKFPLLFGKEKNKPNPKKAKKKKKKEERQKVMENTAFLKKP